MKCVVIAAIVIGLSFISAAHADVMSLRQYVQTVTNPAGYPAQTGNELWQFRQANGAGTGTFLDPWPNYAYYYPYHANYVPLAGILYNTGQGGSAFDGIFAHPGAVPLGIVLDIQTNNTYINSFRILADMVDNGFNSGGIGVSVYTNINSVVTQAGSRVVYTPANTTPDAAEFIIPVNQTFNAGDRVEFYIDPDGSELYDQSAIDIQVTIPEPASIALIAVAAPLFLRRRISRR